MHCKRYRTVVKAQEKTDQPEVSRFDSQLQNAVDALYAAPGFCKALSANDSGESGTHQSGVLLTSRAKSFCFPDKKPEDFLNERILKRQITIHWGNGAETNSVFTWYLSKKELRLTGGLGKANDLLRPDRTGSLFVLVPEGEKDFRGWIFDTEHDIDTLLAAANIGPDQLNAVVQVGKGPLADEPSQVRIEMEVDKRAAILSGKEYPKALDMSRNAIELWKMLYPRQTAAVLTNADAVLLAWQDMEYRLFRHVEQYNELPHVQAGFASINDFLLLAGSITNRRKSRAGKSLENQLGFLFDENNLPYAAQAVTEDKKRPDFLFPSLEKYQDPAWPDDLLVTMAAKTTCKDRWRQVLNEANRRRGKNIYLCTLQQGISRQQMDEMRDEKVILVVPKKYHSYWDSSIPDLPERLWTLEKFIRFIHSTFPE